ncbi:efflux RND transporter permease subunit [Luteitalea sp. TBR-22]|uniref:efflux RND transporter permease subunit n=1 Tax=Luteitalea sp. TBR-22 TaxID=2802971 RepID=UPI001AF5CED3|nr:efflux RND transporter permease subunit [Luteitalea sp. TBR-22]
MRALVTAALRLRLPVLALSVVLILVGLRTTRDAPFDVFPEFAPPLVEIQTEAPGLSSADVEALISVPLEAAMSGVPGLQTLRSKSVLGLSSVVLIFGNGADRLSARQLVQERLTRVIPALPAAARPPVIMSPLSSLSRVMKIGVSSKTLSQVELTTLARWTIRPRLMAIPGVANVAIWGQRDRQLQVLVDPDRLRASGTSLQEVMTATRDAMSVSAGGFLETPNQRLAVAHESPVRDAADLARMALSPRASTTGSPGTSLPVPAVRRLGDVADVVEGFPPPIGDGVINDGPGLLLIVEKQPDGNTLQVTRDVDAALAALAPGLAGVDVDASIFRPATFIEMSIANLNRALMIGCVLVVIVLVAFLWDWRTAVISLTAIPLSLLAAALVLRYWGGTLDTMVIAGLIIALGEVVDDAIIDVENIVRRLRLNRALPAPRPAFDVVLDASLEVRSAVVYGSVIVVMVFLPVFLLEGLAGAFFRPLALSYVLAIAASLLVALVVTPALSLLLLPGDRREHEAPLASWLRVRYRRLLPRLVAAPRAALAIIVASLLATAAAWPLLGEEFLPHFKEYDFLMHWVEKPGTSLEAMTRITLRASRELRAVPGVRNFGAHIGRAEVADEVVGINFTELWISLDPSVDYEKTVARIQAVVDGYPGLQRDLLTYLRERIKEVLTGASATIVVRIYGPDLEELQRKAAEVGKAIGAVGGAADVKVQALTLVPQVQIVYQPERAQLVGLSSASVRDTVATLLRGTKVGEVYDAQKIFDVVVWGTPAMRQDIFALRRLPLELPNGGYAPLASVADVMLAPTPNEITREGGSRRIDVTANVRGRDLGSVARDIEAVLARIPFDAGYHPEVLGEYKARAESQRRLLTLGALSLLGILLVLHVDFGSARMVGLVALTIPFALIGGVASVFLTGGVLSLGSLVGFVTVLGIAARNGIMLVSHYRHLETEEGMPFGADLAVRGAEERLAPILMTALVTALALVPIVAGGDRSGHEIEHPMAVVILGGLVTSTALNLFLLPAIYLKYARRS